MESIKVDKVKLIAVLKENRQKHRQIFEEACDGYKKKAITLLEEKLSIARSGAKVKMMFQLLEPVDQTKDYDRAIGMLEMDLANEVELSEMDYRQYVMDDWNWKQSFLTSNSAYSQTATTLLAQ